MIRELRETDKETWCRLWRGYQDYYEVDLSEGEDELFGRLMNPGPDGPYGFVFEDDDGKLIGLVQYIFHIHTWTAAKRCYLVDLYTSPEARGKGVGRSLILAVDEAARSRGSTQTYWLTQEFNEAGRRLYDKVGKLTPFIKYQM
jgi:GNAT superfamily N-acetyltransferase